MQKECNQCKYAILIYCNKITARNKSIRNPMANRENTRSFLNCILKCPKEIRRNKRKLKNYIKNNIVRVDPFHSCDEFIGDDKKGILSKF